MTIELIDLHPAPADLSRLVQAGLAQQPKQLPAWLLYDAEGSRLFAEICQQPEYTLTRTEITLLEQQATEIATAVGQGVVVEFGIGNARKVDPLLKALRPPTFLALDISRTALEDSLWRLGSGARQHRDAWNLLRPQHSGRPAGPSPLAGGKRRIGFPRQLAGNFRPEDAVTVLKRFRQLLAGGPLLLGLDQPEIQPPRSGLRRCRRRLSCLCQESAASTQPGSERKRPTRAVSLQGPMAAGAAPH